MRARLITTLISTGTTAADYIRLVCGRKPTPVTPIIEEETPTGASDVLESFRNHGRQSWSQYILTGKNVITAMDEQLQDMGFVPYLLSRDSRQFADRVTRGSFVSLPGDDHRFRVEKILWERESIHLRDDEGNEYLVPWKIIKPWDEEDTSR
jgi:hypothetical protein